MPNPSSGKWREDILGYGKPTFREPPSFVSTPAISGSVLRDLLIQNARTNIKIEEDQKFFDQVTKAVDADLLKKEKIELDNIKKIRTKSINSIFGIDI